MKRIVSLILTLVMVLSMFAVVPVCASAQTNLDNKVYIKADGKYYEVEKGQTYTYEYCLNVPNLKISSFDAHTTYDTTGLDFIPAVDEYGDDALEVMFPIMKDVVMNYSEDSIIYYNFSSIRGVRFPEADSVAFSGEFLVTADSGVYEINTELVTLGDSDMNKLVYKGEVFGEYYESQSMPQLTPEEDVVEPTQVETDVPSVIETQEPIPTEIPTEIATVEPTEVEPSEPTEVETAEPTEGETEVETQQPTEETQPETDTPVIPPVPGNYVMLKVDGQLYEAEQGDVFTYVYNFACSEKISSIDVETYYDSTGLELIPAVDDFGEVDTTVMFPVLKDVVYNFNLKDRIPFNYSNIKGVRFPVPEDGVYTDKNQVFVAQFKVTAKAGIYEINTNIKTLGDTDGNKLIFGYQVVDENATILDNQIITDKEFIYPTSDETIRPTVKEFKVYLVNSANWLTPLVYTWNADGNDMNAMWPGDFMTATGEKASNGADIYEFKFNTPYDHVIFNNGGFAQTEDLVFMYDMYYDVVTAKWYSNPDSIPAITPTQPDDPDVEGGEIHIVAGTSDLCGSNWDPSDRNNLMTYNIDKGIYEIVYENVAAGHYEFKVTTDYAWDIGDYNLEGDAKYGGPNAVAKVEQDGSTVIIGFDGNKALLTIIPLQIEPTEVEPSVVPTEDNTEDTLNLGVRIGGKIYGVERGQVYRYVTYLTVPDAKISSLDASVFYDCDGIDIMPYVGGDGEYNLDAIFPVLGSDVVYNFDGIDGQILFNHSSVNGKRFPKDDSVLITFDFRVTAKSGIYDIYTQYTTLVDTDLKKFVMYGEVLDESFTSIDSLQAASIPPMETPATVYLMNSADWNAPYAFAWRESDSYEETMYWPGLKMQLVGYINNVEIYKYKFSKMYDKITFNDCGSQQTHDLDFEYDMVYDNASGKWLEMSTLDTMVPTDDPSGDENVNPTVIPTVAPKPPTDGKVKVYLCNSGGWKDIYAYAWTNDTFEEIGRWPGVKMELIGEMSGYELYSYTFDKAYENIIFNGDSSQSQTEDLKFMSGGIYDNGREEWIYLPVDPSEPIPPTEYETQPSTEDDAEPTQPKPGCGPSDQRDLGDINGDGKINVFDASYIQKYLAGYDGYTDFDEDDFATADVNGDGKVNIFDASHIQKFIAGYFDSL